MSRETAPRSRALTREEYRVRATAVWAMVSLLALALGWTWDAMAPLVGEHGWIAISALIVSQPAADMFRVWLLGPKP